MACVGDEIDAHLFGRAQGRAIADAYRLLVVSDGVGKQFPPLLLSAQIEEFGSGAGGRARRQQRRRRRVAERQSPALERKSVGKGKGMAVRGDLGGRTIINPKKKS